ncbi:MAG: helix-turn-helix transcriptional regulator [Clostridiales bacterium]|nr:helix-turn-helix transcriptional regulator [Clostridiales bacterium]
MAISYKPLWHLLIERNMNKEDLKRAANITSNVVARMSKDSYVSLESLEKICIALACNIQDVVEVFKSEEETYE